MMAGNTKIICHLFFAFDQFCFFAFYQFCIGVEPFYAAWDDIYMGCEGFIEEIEASTGECFAAVYLVDKKQKVTTYSAVIG